MKALLLALGLVATAALLPSPAAAQQTSVVIVLLEPPTELLTEGAPLTLRGTVTFTADYTAALGLMGIPVEYTVTASPAWASVIVSPATDIFPIPSTPGMGVTYTVSRPITVTVTLAQPLDHDATEAVEITATTSPAMLGKSATGRGAVPIVYVAPDDPCAEHADMTQAQMLAYAQAAADAYDAYEASQAESAQSDPDVTIQGTGAAPIPLPWLAVVGFALVGAGVGLVLKKRMGR